MDTKAVRMFTNFISPVPTDTAKRRQAEKIIARKSSYAIVNTWAGSTSWISAKNTMPLTVKKNTTCAYFLIYRTWALNNLYVVYVQLHESQRMEGPLLSSLERHYIGRGLINNYTCRQRSRPTVVSTNKQRICIKRNLPAHNVQKAEKIKRCANCAKRRIENRTHNICTMCNVHLWFTIKRNCFAEYFAYYFTQ